jgi:hypothetical protein
LKINEKLLLLEYNELKNLLHTLDSNGIIILQTKLEEKKEKRKTLINLKDERQKQLINYIKNIKEEKIMGIRLTINRINNAEEMMLYIYEEGELVKSYILNILIYQKQQPKKDFKGLPIYLEQQITRQQYIDLIEETSNISIKDNGEQRVLIKENGYEKLRNKIKEIIKRKFMNVIPINKEEILVKMIEKNNEFYLEIPFKECVKQVKITRREKQKIEGILTKRDNKIIRDNITEFNVKTSVKNCNENLLEKYLLNTIQIIVNTNEMIEDFGANQEDEIVMQKTGEIIIESIEMCILKGSPYENYL